MKLSFANFPIEYTDELGNDELGGLKVIRECGFTCTDFNITQAHIGEDMVARAELLKAELLECGMTAPQAHAPITNPFDPEKTAADLEDLVGKQIHPDTEAESHPDEENNRVPEI